MNKFLKILGYVWMSPLIWVVAQIVALLMLFRQIEFKNKTEWGFVFKAKVGSFFVRKLMQRWRGFGYACFIILRHDVVNNKKVLYHEERHVKQQMLFGVFMPVIYVAHSLYLLIFCKPRSPYYDNVFEKDARRAAEKKLLEN